MLNKLTHMSNVELTMSNVEQTNQSYMSNVEQTNQSYMSNVEQTNQML